MRTWSLAIGPSMAFRLAADARLSTPDYVDDQIWEFRTGDGDPPALSFCTRFGLRARQMRLYPGFGREAEYVTDPASFVSPPVLRLIFPNYLWVECSPMAGLQLRCEAWVPDSHSLAGRFRLTNLDDTTHSLRLVLHAVLLPGENPRPMVETLWEGASVLVGQTANLVPVLFLAGGATPGQAPHPALAISFDLEPGASKTIPWAQVALRSGDASFAAARDLAGRPWDEEIARLEMVNNGQVEIETGDPDWDLALALAQQAALGSFVGPTPHLPSPSFVLNRNPDHGYSPRGDGRDYSLGWDGQPALTSFSIAPLILPAAPDWAKGLVRNFLVTQSADGTIDGKPGLGGQRSGTLAVPLLANLAWRIYQHTEDRAFLENCFDPLLEFLEAWFTPAHDRDQDGHPEWDHTLHAGFDDWPSFVPWSEWGQGLDLTKAETPDLASYLYRECLALIEAAEVLDRNEVIPNLEQRAERLRQAVEASWSEETATYHHLDRDVHGSPAGVLLGQGHGEFKLRLEQEFSPAVRILLRCQGPEAEAHALNVMIRGRAVRSRSASERLTTLDFQWFWDRGSATSQRTYTLLRGVEVRGLPSQFTTQVWAADYSRQDASLLLPLWAGIPDAGRAQRLIDRALSDPVRFWRANGIPINAASDAAYSPDHRSGVGAVGMLWNEMLGEGLIAYGRRAQAADLTARLMAAVIQSIRRHGTFRQWYHPDRPEAFGERDHPAGLAAFSLFLSCLGVRLITPRKVRLEGANPFPWPVTVRWRGLEVRREPGEAATIIFPDGQQVESMGQEPRILEQAEGPGLP
ncbi:MAG: hypothetical protein AB1449_12815 [Chloroflexota bacterium]